MNIRRIRTIALFSALTLGGAALTLAAFLHVQASGRDEDLVAQPAAPGAVTPTAGATRLYVDDDSGFTIELPKEWMANLDVNDGSEPVHYRDVPDLVGAVEFESEDKLTGLSVTVTEVGQDMAQWVAGNGYGVPGAARYFTVGMSPAVVGVQDTSGRVNFSERWDEQYQYNDGFNVVDGGRNFSVSFHTGTPLTTSAESMAQMKRTRTAWLKARQTFRVHPPLGFNGADVDDEFAKLGFVLKLPQEWNLKARTTIGPDEAAADIRFRDIVGKTEALNDDGTIAVTVKVLKSDVSIDVWGAWFGYRGFQFGEASEPAFYGKHRVATSWSQGWLEYDVDTDTYSLTDAFDVWADGTYYAIKVRMAASPDLDLMRARSQAWRIARETFELVPAVNE